MCGVFVRARVCIDFVTVSPVKDLTAVDLYGPFNTSYYYCYFVLGMWWRQTSDSAYVSDPRLRWSSGTFRHGIYVFSTVRIPFQRDLLDGHVVLYLLRFLLWPNESLFKTRHTYSISSVTNRQTPDDTSEKTDDGFFINTKNAWFFFFLFTHTTHV